MTESRSAPIPTVRSTLRGLAPLLALLLLAIPAGPLAWAQGGNTIREIELGGLERLSAADILSRMKVKVGQEYDAEELDQEYQRLWKSGHFLYINKPIVTDFEGGKRIEINFVERVVIGQVRILGYRELGRETLGARLRTQPRGLLNPFDVRQDRLELEAFYREKGFFFVEVSTRDEMQNGFAVVTFDVQEGPRVLIREVQYNGNSALEDSDLRRVMGTRARSWPVGVPHSGIFDPDVFAEDLRTLTSLYVSEGYFDAVVSAEDYSFSFDRSDLYLGIRIHEGERYKVAGIEFEIEGRGVYTENILRRDLTMKVGEYFDGRKVDQDVRRLQDLYWDYAYIDARIEFDTVIPLDGNEVTLRYRITEGEKIYIAGVEIEGNHETRDKVIRRELTFFPGDPVSFDEWQQSRSNLFRLDYFANVSIRQVPTATPTRRDVIVGVDEKETGRLLFGFGLTSGRGAAGNFAIFKRNFDIADAPEDFLDIPNAFTGGGQTMILEAQPGTEQSRYRLEFRDPRFLDTHTSLSLRGLRADFIRNEFDEDRTSGEIAIGQRLPRDPNLYAELAYRYELVDINNIDADAPPDVFEAEGNTRISALRAEITYDRRMLRPLLGPVDGWLGRVSYEYGGGFLGAELDFSKGTAFFGMYKTVRSDREADRHILTFKNTFGWIEPHHNTRSIPVFERFYLGGARTVRGFRFRGLGPHFQRNEIGGTIEHHANLEYTFPLVDDTIRGIGFCDFGNLASDVESFSLDRYRVTVGGGVLLNIRFLGQFIPISLTWGEAIRSEDEDRERNFLFDIGFGF